MAPKIKRKESFEQLQEEVKKLDNDVSKIKEDDSSLFCMQPPFLIQVFLIVKGQFRLNLSVNLF